MPAGKIDEHLKSCASCRHELERQRDVIELLRGQSRRSFAEDVCDRIAVPIEESKGRPKTGHELWPFVVLGVIARRGAFCGIILPEILWLRAQNFGEQCEK